MKKIIKLLSLAMAALCCVVCLSSCGGGQKAGEEDTQIKMEDGEDSGIKQAKITIANTTGKDAVKLLSRLSSSKSDEWSDNILSQEYLHNNKAVEITYNVGDDNVYDLRLVYEDGTYTDFTNLDFKNAKSVIYLGGDESQTS